MVPYIFYEPFHFEIDRLLNDLSLWNQDRKAGSCDAAASAPVVRSFKPRQVQDVFISCFLHSNTEHRLDLHEDTEENVVTATFEFPGFSKDEVQINFQNGKLTVSAETKKSEHRADTGYTFNERLHGKFSRTLQLPQGIQVCRSFLNLLEWMSTDDYRLHRVNRSKQPWKMVSWLWRSQRPCLKSHQRRSLFKRRPRIRKVTRRTSTYEFHSSITTIFATLFILITTYTCAIRILI